MRKTQKRNIALLHDQKGLSLLQVLIGLMVFGLLAEGFMQGYKSWQNSRTDARVRTAYEKTTVSLAAFVTRNGHYPCPAPLDLIPGEAGFGRAVANCGASGVAQGALPVADLGLPMDAIADPFGSKLLYAVTAAYTNPATYTPGTAGHAITLSGRAYDNTVTQAQQVPFVIVSHGPDRKGAVSLTGRAPVLACNARPGQDVANCDGNAAFANFPRGRAAGAQWFDDYLTYSLVQKETTLWAIAPDSGGGAGLSIVNRNKGNVGIGTANPSAKLNVHGGNLRVEAGPGAGNIVSTGQIDVLQGSRVNATDVEAGGSIHIKDEVRSNTRIKANRFCYGVDVGSC